MKKFLLMLIVILMIVSFAQSEEYYFRFKESNKSEINRINKVVSVDNYKEGWVYAYANEKQFSNFKFEGYEFELLTHPGKLINPKMTDNIKGLKDWDAYPTHGAYISQMQQFAIDYPALCRLDTIGYSEENRPLLAVKLSDNVAVEEAEPEFFYTGTMHGDETTGYVLLLRLIDFLLVNYGETTDDGVRATNLLDNMEIWINPAANPDGTYASGDHTVDGATRNNANYVNLNRNFPDAVDGDHSDGNSWQAETIAMMDWAEAHSFVISANFHGGIELVNYPWDTWVTRHADDAWWQLVSRRYADAAQSNSPSGYMDAENNGITHGYDWYEADGTRQDYMNYFQNCREVTIELSNTKLLPASQLPAHWTYNKESFLRYMEEVFQGIQGMVTNEEGDPLAATITIVGHDNNNSFVKTDSDFGDYYRPIFAGTYDLYIEAGEDYVPVTISDVSVTSDAITTLDVVLEHMATQDVSGFITMADDASAEGAKIKINSDSTYADGMSHFEFSQINIGELSIDVTKAGYLPFHFDTLLTADNPMNLEFTLYPLPAVTITPDSIGITVEPGGEDALSFYIKNESMSTLTVYGITDQMTAKGNVNQLPEQKNTPQYAKGEKEKTYPAQIKNSGGPDGYGYTWIDSDEPSGPAYDWIDISTIGINSGIHDDETVSDPFNIGFNFEFYGETYNQVYICSNGWISFEDQSSGYYTNGGIPSSSTPNNILAPFWDDMNLASSGDIFYYHDAANQRFIVQYKDVPRWNDGSSVMNFQAIISASGSIKYQYQSVTGTVNSQTIGIENHIGNDGLQVVYNANYIHNEMAILFSRGASWLTYDSFSGDVLPGDSVEVTLNFNTTGLSEGVYHSMLSIENNGVNSVEQKLVTLTVGTITGIENGLSIVPGKYELQQNYPNPFNPTTTIAYSLIEPQNVTLKIFNVLGEEVRTLVNNTHQPAKSYKVEWDGKNNTGHMVASGMYIYHIEAGSFVNSRKMILIK